MCSESAQGARRQRRPAPAPLGADSPTWSLDDRAFGAGPDVRQYLARSPEQPGMPTRLDINTRVDAPIEELFDLMADPETEVDWNPDAIEVRRIDQGAIGPGAEWQGRYRG